MLSPASLRVCCLAVMAPALTKADRQADCLPVVLPEPFYVSETAEILSSEDNTNKIIISKIDYKTAWPPSHRKPYMPKVWLRQSDRTKHGFPFKNRFSVADIRKPSAYSGLQTNAAHKNKPWHYTKVIATFTNKLRLNHTMSKNTTNENMGLAKANTSLGLQDLKKMKKISQLHLNKEDTTLLESDGESSPDLPDSTSSDFQGRTLLTVVSPVSKDILNENHVFDSECDVFTPSASQDGLQSNAFNLSLEANERNKNTPSECLSNCNISEFNADLKVADSPLASNAPLLVTKSETTYPEVTDIEDTFCIEESAECLLDSSTSVSSKSSDVPSGDVQHCESQDPLNMPSEVSSFEKSESVVHVPGLFSGTWNLSSCEERFNSLFCTLSSEAPLLGKGFNALDVFCSEIGDIANLNFSATTASLLEAVEWEKSTKQEKLQIESNEICCNMTSEERKSISELISEKEKALTSGIEHLQLLQCQQMNIHVGKQIQNFVGHFQNKLGISCQRPVQPSSSKPGKELVDLKAELLQSEDVKNLSTAALVSLVRKLESSGSPGKLLPQHKNVILDADSPSEKVTVVFDPEDFADVKHTSNVLLNSMKNILKSVDSDLTEESSDEDNLHEIKVEEASDASLSNQKRSLWKCLTESTALRSRSAWLIAQIQELEYQLRYYDGKLKESHKGQDDLCFKEKITSERTALSMPLSAESLQVSAKQATLKKGIRHLNGYLDHSTIPDATHVMQHSASWSSSSQFEIDLQQNRSTMPVLDESCSRTRPVNITSSKHKLLYVDSLPASNSKVAKLSTINCYCNSLNTMQPCVLCAGCYNSVQSVDPDSMMLHDRIALLDPIFHPVLSLEKEIPMGLHFENTLKLTEAQYQIFQPTSPVVNHRRMRFGAKPKRFSEMRNHRKFNRYARSLSAKYRNKHVQNSKHLRKHRLVFGKWRRLNKNKRYFHSRDRLRYSVASSGSSHDSPVPSPMSMFDDGSGLDYMKRRRDDDQFDIDDVILPLNSKIGRTVEVLKYKDIACPSWRCKDKQGLDETDEIENTSDATFIRRHERSEIEERKQLRSNPFGLNRRARRMHRCDSRADSSGANTPDPVLLYNQDIMFQVPSSLVAGPSSPALSPPTTPSSTAIISDDSQPSCGNGAPLGYERRKTLVQKRSLEDNYRAASNDSDEIQPYTKREFPLTDQEYEVALACSTHLEEDMENPNSGPSCPASPESYTSSTSTVEEDDDITDPEWTVVKRESGPNQALVLKFAKR